MVKISIELHTEENTSIFQHDSTFTSPLFYLGILYLQPNASKTYLSINAPFFVSSVLNLNLISKKAQHSHIAILFLKTGIQSITILLYVPRCRSL